MLGVAFNQYGAGIVAFSDIAKLEFAFDCLAHCFVESISFLFGHVQILVHEFAIVLQIEEDAVRQIRANFVFENFFCVHDCQSM